jgi:hypothetical protein
MIKTGDNYEYFNRLTSSIFALVIGDIALSISLNGLKDMNERICKECLKKGQIATANFGGQFVCKICGKLQTMVPSIGHGEACRECQEKGYCKYCAKKMFEII